MPDNSYNISVFGMGKVGLILSACLAAAGHRVIGVDVDEPLINRINGGTIESSEPGLEAKLKKGKERFTVTNDAAGAVAETDVTYIILPTPSNSSGGFSLRYVLGACKEIGGALKAKSKFHLVCVVSTVLPGSSELFIVPELEKASGRRVSRDFGYCYSPAFIALGEVVTGFVSPSYILIGETDQRSGDIAEAIAGTMITNDAPVERMTLAEAEISKLASNAHETMRVSFANMLLQICHELPGVAVDSITNTLRYRMRDRNFKGAVPYGGPCWPRDNLALSAFMECLGISGALPLSTHQFNQDHSVFVTERILQLTKKGETIGILGLAYKPGTPVTECSFALDLAGWLAEKGRAVLAWDPMVTEGTDTTLPSSIRIADTLEDCVEQAAVVVIVNPLQEVLDADWKIAGDRLIIDCWRCLEEPQIRLISKYHGLGAGALSKGSSLSERIEFEKFCILSA